ALYPLVDYVAINVSSPNTPGLRDLQQPSRLDELLGALLETRQSLAADRRAKPLLVKIAPDLAPDDEVAIAEVVTGRGADGLIVGNTTIARPPVVAGRHRGETGGLSGAPLFLRSTEQLLRFHRLTGGKLPLIGVGGILRGADAYAKIRAGASALQLYTALIYRGPNTVVRIVAELEGLLERDGIRLSDARGIDAGA
ncbi:MAG: dihydroorotate dehydrogenase (quinone), partial [Geminicoccaceae bacterium]